MLVAETLANIDMPLVMKSIVIPLGVPAAVIIVALLFGIYLNRRIKNYINAHYTISAEDSFIFILLKGMQGLPVLFSLMFGLYVLIDILPLPATIDHILYCVLLTIVVFAIARLIARSLNALVEIKTQKLGRSTTSTTLLSNSITFVVYIIFGLTLLTHYGISITPLITALGIGSMAIAFGLQETLANLFAGVHLILSKQIRIDDYIKLASGEEGRVIDISWRFTTILSINGNAIIIPNQKIASTIITNYNMPKQELSITIEMGISYESDLDRVEASILDVARNVTAKLEGDTPTTPPALYFTKFGDFSIDLKVILHPSKFSNQNPLRHLFIKEVISRCRQEGINIPYPIRTVINTSQKEFEESNLSRRD